MNVEGCPIFVDIDGTLTSKSTAGGAPIQARIEKIKKMIASGAEVVVWSGGGTAYAKEFCQRHGLKPIAALGKPSLYVDDSPTVRPPGKPSVISPDEFFGR